MFDWNYDTSRNGGNLIELHDVYDCEVGVSQPTEVFHHYKPEVSLSLTT